MGSMARYYDPSQGLPMSPPLSGVRVMAQGGDCGSSPYVARQSRWMGYSGLFPATWSFSPQRASEGQPGHRVAEP